MNDPTVQTPLGPTHMSGQLSVSLSEIEAMGRKAARGAGYEWGIAEEAGRAARRLAEWRLSGPEMLARLLQEISAGPRDHAPECGDATWSAPRSPLCPIAAGAALSDHAREIAAGRRIELVSPARPLLLVPFVHAVANRTGCIVVLEGEDLNVSVTGHGPAAVDWEALDRPEFRALTVALGSNRPGLALAPRSASWPVDIDAWAILDGFARHTYVPASEASRISGAGSGLIDED